MGGVGRALALPLVLTVAPLAAEAQPPPAVRQWANQAGVTAPLRAWCQAQFRPGQRGWAVAANGRYLVIDGVGAVVELASFTGEPDLSCYSRAAALDLNRSIQRSETVSGRIAPPFGTSIVCAFVEPTTAKCWQYSPPRAPTWKSAGGPRRAWRRSRRRRQSRQSRRRRETGCACRCRVRWRSWCGASFQRRRNDGSRRPTANGVRRNGARRISADPATT